MMRQSYEPRKASLRSMAKRGTANANALFRKIMPANTALAAMGVKLGACGASRATTSSATRQAASGSSIPRTEADRRAFDSRAIASFPLIGCKLPENHVIRLHFVYTKTFISIGRIDPELPILLAGAAALILNI